MNNNAEFNIVKTPMQQKSRQLSAGWTIENLSSETTTISPIENKHSGYPFGVYIDAEPVILINIINWIKKTFNEGDHLTGNALEKRVWFRNEKDRTLLLLKYSQA